LTLELDDNIDSQASVKTVGHMPLEYTHPYPVDKAATEYGTAR